MARCISQVTGRGQNSLPIVGVMGSGKRADETRCRALGEWLATQRVHLLTGGGRGVMDAVSRGFFETSPRAGLVIGVLPAAAENAHTTAVGYPNPWVELPIRTHLHLSGKDGTDVRSRNHINVLSADVVIALPGSWGTHSEISLAVAYGKPVVAYLQANEDIPRIPDGVPVLRGLEDVQGFVLEALGRAP